MFHYFAPESLLEPLAQPFYAGFVCCTRESWKPLNVFVLEIAWMNELGTPSKWVYLCVTFKLSL